MEYDFVKETLPAVLAVGLMTFTVGVFAGVVLQKRKGQTSKLSELQMFGMLAFLLFFIADIAKLTEFDYPKIALTFSFILGEIAGEWIEKRREKK